MKTRRGVLATSWAISGLLSLIFALVCRAGTVAEILELQRAGAAEDLIKKTVTLEQPFTVNDLIMLSEAQVPLSLIEHYLKQKPPRAKLTVEEMTYAESHGVSQPYLAAFNGSVPVPEVAEPSQFPPDAGGTLVTQRDLERERMMQNCVWLDASGTSVIQFDEDDFAPLFTALSVDGKPLLREGYNMRGWASASCAVVKPGTHDVCIIPEARPPRFRGDGTTRQAFMFGGKSYPALIGRITVSDKETYVVRKGQPFLRGYNPDTGEVSPDPFAPEIRVRTR